jgi:general L-amino acid transport system substrate-binding protein
MHRSVSATLRCAIVAAAIVAAVRSAPAATDDVVARVRAHDVLRCAGIIRPGFAVPALDGKHWYGLAADVCRAVAAAVLGPGARIEFRPYLAGSPEVQRYAASDDDIVFLSGEQLVGAAAAAAGSLELGPVIAHDGIALLVRAGGPARVAGLGGKTICVEAGSPADRALVQYFFQNALTLREHPFQETDEMRQAYAGGDCDALAGPLSTLASVRADPQDGRRSDRILPDLIADDPIFAATPADARWARIVWWTFSALVDSEAFGASAQATDGGVTGVPPALAAELDLKRSWAQDALAVGGDYGHLFDRNLGAGSRLGLARGANALWNEGGLIFGLRVQ